ncbi:hypothetical protein OJ963_09855 [Streptomyces sp. RS2]|nr:hypothetical protein [Streptomyces sp. RS2]MCW1094282.1 hypothetical protein [Streptomyces sp. RS2]
MERRRTVRPLAVVAEGAAAAGAATGSGTGSAAGARGATGAAGAGGAAEGVAGACSATRSSVPSTSWSTLRPTFRSVSCPAAVGGTVRDTACGTGWADPGSTIRFFGRTTMARVPW